MAFRARSPGGAAAVDRSDSRALKGRPALARRRDQRGGGTGQVPNDVSSAATISTSLPFHRTVGGGASHGAGPTKVTTSSNHPPETPRTYPQ